jgi:uncharacterized membrane protein
MVPLIALVVSFMLFFAAGGIGLGVFADIGFDLRCALAVMFALTATAHWGKKRADLVRMVPPSFPNAGLLVTVSGVLELLGAIGLLIPATARIAAVCLAVMLIALFPANVYAARKRLTIGGRPVPTLPLRTAIQIVFVGALVAAAWVR